MTMIIRALGAVALVALAGCSGFRAGPASPFQNIETSLRQLEQSYSATRIRRCFAVPLGEHDGSDPHRVCRDTIAQGLMAAIDVRYAMYEQELLDNNRYGGLALALAQLGLTAAASVSGAGAAPSLAAAATGIGGAREAVDREALLNRTAGALLSAMHARRNELGLGIRQGLRLRSDEYPLGVALSDIMAYYRAGTLNGATETLGQTSAARASQARDALNDSVGLVPARPAVAAQVSGVAAPAASAPRRAPLVASPLAVPGAAPLAVPGAPPAVLPGATRRPAAPPPVAATGRPIPSRPPPLQGVAGDPQAAALRACFFGPGGAAALEAAGRAGTARAAALPDAVQPDSDPVGFLNDPTPATAELRRLVLADPETRAACGLN